MKHEEAYKKATRAFRDDEDDILLRLAKLKERADYRKYFTPELREAVESAYFKMEEANAKGPGQLADDEEVHNTSADFLGNLRHRFCIQKFGIPPHLTTAEWLDVLDPRMDVREIPPKVRRSVLPRLFYTPGICEVVPKSYKLNKHPPKIAETTSPDCAPFERLWKIDLRKKPSLLIKEFKARLAIVDARRGMDPAAYNEWKQDRSRKRKEEWDHLEVWKLRRQRKGFSEIARVLRINVSTAKMRFFRAYDLIERRPYNREKYKLEHWNLRVCATCPDNSDHGGTCKELCPDMLELVTKAITPLKSRGNFEMIETAQIADEWFASEARKRQTNEEG